MREKIHDLCGVSNTFLQFYSSLLCNDTDHNGRGDVNYFPKQLWVPLLMKKVTVTSEFAASSYPDALFTCSQFTQVILMLSLLGVGPSL